MLHKILIFLDFYIHTATGKIQNPTLKVLFKHRKHPTIIAIQNNYYTKIKSSYFFKSQKSI